MVWIYKTTIKNLRQKHTVETVLNKIVGNNHWNIDLEDSDKVLCLEATKRKIKQVEHFLTMAGFNFENLPYQI